jgi:hypothetical protein
MFAAIAIGCSTSYLATFSSARAQTFKAQFTLMAENAKITRQRLTLSDVHAQVFVVESEGSDALGVTAPAIPFLERWQSINHSMRPQGILFAHAKEHLHPYRAINFTIDRPKAVKADNESSWSFEVTHASTESPKQFAEGKDLGPVTLTIVMVHTKKEFDQGLVCGPWELESLQSHLELFQ